MDQRPVRAFQNETKMNSQNYPDANALKRGINESGTINVRPEDAPALTHSTNHLIYALD